MLQSAELQLRLRAQAGELVDGPLAAALCEVQEGTIRVWAKRGKISPVTYAPDEYEVQPRAWYALADVLALADAKGVDLSGKCYPDEDADLLALATDPAQALQAAHRRRLPRPSIDFSDDAAEEL